MNKKKKKVYIISLIIVFFSSLMVGNAIFWTEHIHLPGELTDESVKFAVTLTIVSIPIIRLLYSKYGDKDLQSEFLTRNVIKFDKYINRTGKPTSPGITKVEEMKLITSDEVQNIDYDDILKKVKKKIIATENLEENQYYQKSKNEPLIDIDNLLKEYNIEKKLYLKAKGYYERSIFKKTLNPCVKEDKEVLNWEEIKLINDLGLLYQETDFPYLVTFDIDDESIIRAFEFKNYVRNRNIFIPNLNNLDSLNNGFEFEEYVVIFLKNNNFTDIQKLSNFEKNGADILAIKDNIRYAFKCKYYSKSVGLGAVKEVINGANYHYARVPVVVTNSTFNKNARTHGDLYNVQLWDRLYLAEKRRK